MKFHGVPQDIEIPEWANWIAQDADGCWYAFGHQPVMVTLLSGCCWWDVGDKKQLCQAPPPADWTTELWKITWR